jgi:hypothetical protein
MEFWTKRGMGYFALTVSRKKNSETILFSRKNRLLNTP